MRANTTIMLTAIFVLAGLGACTTGGTGTHAGGNICRAADASKLVGELAPDDATLLRRTGSTVIRRLAPGDMSTQDYREERLTITIADGRVISASCG